MNQLFELLDNSEEQEKQLFDFLQQDKNNMMNFLKIVVQTPNNIDFKYPFIVSELVYGSYEQLLQMMFDWNAEPIQYLLTFFDYPQNETSCGYFEKIIRPLILLKPNEIQPYLNVTKWIQFIELESIQNVFITIFACNNLDENFKRNLFNIFFTQNPITDDMYRVILKYTDQLQDYLKQNPQIIDIVCNQQPLTFNQLSLIEYFFTQNLLNIMWLCSQIKYLTSLIQVEFDSQVQMMNFLYKSQGLNPRDLKLIQILSQSIERPETIHFQEIVLELLIKYEWNNALQNIAVQMYEEMSKSQTPHKQYFLTIINDFIQQKIEFQQQDYGLKTKIAKGYRWVFSNIVKLFELDFQSAQEINSIEAKYLLNEDPKVNRERQSFNILERVSERRSQWTKKCQEEDNVQNFDSQNKQMETEDDQNNQEEEINMPQFRQRSSFGFKLPQIVNDDDENNIEKPNFQFEKDDNC